MVAQGGGAGLKAAHLLIRLLCCSLSTAVLKFTQCSQQREEDTQLDVVSNNRLEEHLRLGFNNVSTAAHTADTLRSSVFLKFDLD